MNAAATDDEPCGEPGFVSTGAKGAILAFALTALVLAAVYLVVGGKEKPGEERQAESHLRTMPSLSSLDESEATKAPKTSPAPDPRMSAPAGKPPADVTPPARPPAQARPDAPAAQSPEQGKSPGTQREEGRPWVMQFASGLSKTASQHVVDQLKKGGYDAYVMETEVKGKVWYRVRVGFFPSREEARRVAQEITRSYGLQSPWLARQPQE